MPEEIEKNALVASIESAEKPRGNRKKKIFVMTSFLLFVLLAAAASVFIWWVYFREFVSTDDAYVGGNIVLLSSRQEGTVISYNTDDTNFVKAGDVLVKIDPTDYLGNLEMKKANLASAARQVREDYENVQEKVANIAVEESKYLKAELDYKNRVGLMETDSIPKEEFEHAKSNYETSKASLELARHQLNSAKAALGNTSMEDDPKVVKAKAELVLAYLAVQRTTILSPVTGYIAKRSVQLGQNIKAGTPLMNIVPLDNLWIEANYKETQLENVRIGQPVKLISDLYGREVVFHGKVEGFVPGSGSVFSLLPPQNTTGNWIKIVQRVPVRISIDMEQVKKHPLVLGLSFYSTIDITDKSGPVLLDKPVEEIAKTDVYDVNLQPAYDLANQIIKDNLNYSDKTDFGN